MPLSLGEVWQAVWASMGIGEEIEPLAQQAITRIRLPRICMAVLGGANLAIAGTIMQAVFRNPLASPEILGTTQGAALGTTAAVWFGWAGVWQQAVPLSAFAGAVVVTVVVYGLAGGARGLTVGSLLLAGIAMNTLVGALVSFAVLKSSDELWQQGSSILFWLMGNFDKTMPEDLWVVGGGLLLFGVGLLPFLRDMDLLTLRDAGARSLGVDVLRLRAWLLTISCGLTAVTVAHTGGIAFVGLIVPHMARLLVGPAHRGLVPCAALLGATILLLADYVCRVPLADTGLQVGVVLALLGTPFFLLLLLRLRRGERV